MAKSVIMGFPLIDRAAMERSAVTHFVEII